MLIYQCLFFTEDYVTYWENIECQTDVDLLAILRSRILSDGWTSGEAWLGETLICRVHRIVPPGVV